MAYKPERSIQLMGFWDPDIVPLHMHMKVCHVPAACASAPARFGGTAQACNQRICMHGMRRPPPL